MIRNIVITSFFFIYFLTAERSYSLFDCKKVPLDEKIVHILNYPNGIFIEAGAHDGLSQSNTKRLEEFHGWTGILIEPAEILFPILVSNRPYSKCFQCALGSFDEDNTFVEGDFDGSLMGSVNGSRLNHSSTHTVLMRSLQSILDEEKISHVNFLSLDTEGYELNILKGIDFSITSFDYLLIEIYNHQFKEIVSLLQSKGYELIENFSNYNEIDNPRWEGTHNDYLFRRVENFVY